MINVNLNNAPFAKGYMMQEHCKQNSQPSTTSSDTDKFAEACRASARKYNARRMRLGQMFRTVQEETYGAWSAWDEALGRL
jgi:hypothetical protein